MTETTRKSTLMQLQASTEKKILVSAGAMFFLILVVYGLGIPNPNVILISGVVFCTAVFGFGGGTVAAIIMLFYTLFFFSTDNSFTQFTSQNLEKVVVSIIGIVADVLFVSSLKRSEVEAFRKVDALTERLNRENELLQNISFKDALTGICNRTALRQDYDSYQGHEVTVMMMDLDDFKLINDTQGHDEGDRILKETGSILAGIFGEKRCYRYGGDEFLVILPDVSKREFEEKLTVLMRSRPSVVIDGGVSGTGTAAGGSAHTQDSTAGGASSGQGAAAGGGSRRLSFSTGYVHAMLDGHEKLNSLIINADERMYRAKRMKKRAAVTAKNAAEQEYREYTVAELRDYLKKMSKEYAIVRAVDPIESRVIRLHENGQISLEERCYSIWDSNQKCLNCSSGSACRTGCRRLKKEYFKDNVYNIRSEPVTILLPDGVAYDAVIELVSIEAGKGAASVEVNDRAAEDVGNRSAKYRALHDSMTDVLNEEAFHELSRERIRSDPGGAWVMVMADILDLHLVNKEYGFKKGNDILIKTASLLRGAAQEPDGLCGRLGGERFALLIPDSKFREDSLKDAAWELAALYSVGDEPLQIHFGVYRTKNAAVPASSIPISIMCSRAEAALRSIREDRDRFVAYL